MKYKKGFIAGVIIGLSMTIFVYISYECTDCFSCGFMGIEYCRNFGGACPIAGIFMEVITIASFPFIISGFFIYQFFSFDLDVIKFFYLLTPLYLIYWGFLGYLIQKFSHRYGYKW